MAPDKDDEFYTIENINLQLGLLSGRPIPVYPFVRESGCDMAVVVRPYLDAAMSFLHAAVRVRMQSQIEIRVTDFWPEAIKALSTIWDPGFASTCMVCAVAVDVASDVLFFNSDVANRTIDPLLVSRSDAVMAELRAVLPLIEKCSNSIGT